MQGLFAASCGDAWFLARAIRYGTVAAPGRLFSIRLSPSLDAKKLCGIAS